MTAMAKAFYRRRLPHWHPEGKALFLTWRLHGTMPRQPEVTFAAFDKLLDQTKVGPLFLNIPEVADAVAEEIVREEGLRLWAWVIMPNHVHLLADAVNRETEDWVRLLKLIKGRSARRANTILSRTGSPFWQEETFDHWVRTDGEFAKVKRYIERNPSNASLAASPEQFRWSSAWRGLQSANPETK